MAKASDSKNSYSSRNIPALMTGLTPHLIINAFSIFAITINKESPKSVACTQKLVMLFSVYFFLGSYLYYLNFATFGVFLFLRLSFTIGNWFHVLQPTKTEKKITASVMRDPMRYRSTVAGQLHLVFSKPI
jgi:hypothetical protein